MLIKMMVMVVVMMTTTMMMLKMLMMVMMMTMMVMVVKNHIDGHSDNHAAITKEHNFKILIGSNSHYNRNSQNSHHGHKQTSYAEQ